MVRRCGWLAVVIALAACEQPESQPDIPALMVQLRAADEEKSGQARLALLRIGAPAVPALTELLRSPEPGERKLGLTMLWGLGARAEPALPEVIRLMADPDPAIRETAAMVAEVVGPAAAPAIPALVKLLRDPEVAVRQRAVVALGAIGPAATEAIPALTDAARFDPLRTQSEEAIRRIRGR